MKFFRVFIMISLGVLGMGCPRVTRPPEDITYEDIPSYSWETLKLQRSFRFDYHSYSNVFSFEVEGKGQIVTPDVLRFKGIWKLGDEERELDLAAAGDYQLEKEAGDWVAHQRSEEAKIVGQVGKVLEKSLQRKKGKGFTLIEDAGRTLTYSFKPNLAYLDPKFEKKFDAKLVVDGRSLLAREIHIISDDAEVGFDFAVSAINRSRSIDLPFSANFMITYSPEWGSISRAKSGLRSRLKQLGRESRIKTKQGEIEVTLALPVDEGIARMLGEPGEIAFLGLDLEGSSPTISKKGSVSDIFHLTDTIARPEVRSTELGFDSLSRPFVELSLSKAEISKGSFDYLGVAVDGVLYEVFNLDIASDLIRISNVATYHEAVVLALKLERPMKAGLSFVGRRSIR